MKKIIAILLSLVLILGCLAGCAKTATEESSKPATEQTTTEQKTEKPTEEKPAEAVKELGTLPLSDSHEVITIGVRADANTEDFETNDYTLWLEEQTGIDLQFVTFSADKDEAVTQLNLMIGADEKLPDILWYFEGVDSTLRSELGQDGVFIDLSDYFDNDAYWFWQNYDQMSEKAKASIFANERDVTTGGLYGFPHYEEMPGATNFTQINANWLKAIGEDIPTNIDELYNVLKKFAEEDPNGNGKADELPMIGYDGYRADITMFLTNAFVYCNDAYFFNATDGKLWVPYNTDEYRQGLQYMNKLYSEGLLAPMTFTIKENSEMTPIFTPADGVSLVGIIGSHPILTTEVDNPVLYEYVEMPYLAAATDKGGYASRNDDNYQYRTFITRSCENPELAFKLLDFMSSWESSMRQRYGVYGRDWTDADEGSVDCYGQPALVKILDDSAFSSQNNMCWHALDGAVLPLCLYASQYNNDGSWTSFRSAFVNAAAVNTTAGTGTAIQPSELVYTLIYNDEENEIVADVSTIIKDYVKEARAMFITGVMDPNDDAQWQSYLDALESQGLSNWLDAAQAAYTRMHS